MRAKIQGKRKSNFFFFLVEQVTNGWLRLFNIALMKKV